jgi:hypothetical protein
VRVRFPPQAPFDNPRQSKEEQNPLEIAGFFLLFIQRRVVEHPVRPRNLQGKILIKKENGTGAGQTEKANKKGLRYFSETPVFLVGARGFEPPTL